MVFCGAVTGILYRGRFLRRGLRFGDLKANMGEIPEQENSCVRPLIEVSAASFVNAAFHQNSIPFLRELRILGTGISEDLRELTLSLSSQPEFLKAKCWNISFLPQDGIVRLSDLDVS